MIAPITPIKALQAKQESIPDFVIEAFNELIIKGMNTSGSVCIKQKDVVALITSKQQISSNAIYSSGWLDVENIYRSAGWNVEYDSPGYNESYDATFTFSKNNSAINITR